MKYQKPQHKKVLTAVKNLLIICILLITAGLLQQVLMFFLMFMQI